MNRRNSAGRETLCVLNRATILDNAATQLINPLDITILIIRKVQNIQLIAEMRFLIGWPCKPDRRQIKLSAANFLSFRSSSRSAYCLKSYTRSSLRSASLNTH